MAAVRKGREGIEESTAAGGRPRGQHLTLHTIMATCTVHRGSLTFDAKARCDMEPGGGPGHKGVLKCVVAGCRKLMGLDEAIPTQVDRNIQHHAF